jgi:4-amino-4-deoxy-L-arabinose transferase-like glycosyltransferase
MEIADQLKDKRQSNLYLSIIILSGIFFFIPFLGKVHLFDWDEINFAESAREMIVTHNYHRVQINFLPFSEKPPLFFWLQASAMNVFGVNEFAARLPNAVFGIITLITLFLIGKKYKSARFGFIWAISYLGTFLPHVYFKSAIIDPVFNYFIFMGIFFMYKDLAGNILKHKFVYISLAGIFIGLGTLTKGPVALLVFLLVFLAYFIFKRFRNFSGIGKILCFAFFFTAVCLLWFGQEIMENGLWFLKEFLAVQADLFLHPVASHGEPFYYHFVVVFIGCFPISIISLPIFFSKNMGTNADFLRIMKILFWTVMILFSLSTTKIVHYSSLTYMPLAFLATVYLDKILESNLKMKKWMLALIVFMGFVFSFLLAALPYVANHHELILPYLKDPFAAASLNVPVNWSGFESLTGVGYFICVLAAVLLFSKRKNRVAILILFYSTAVCLFIYLITVVPKIEQYSQGPAIRFYESLQGKDVYVWPVGFRSYAQYFYAKKPAFPVYGEADLDFLLKGNISRPAFFVVKNTNTNFDSTCNGCKLVKEEGGFKFYERDAVTNQK